MSVVMNFIDKNQSKEWYRFHVDFIPSVNSYLEATKDYKRYEDENCDGDDEYNPDDYEEIDMEEEEPKKKNQPDEDGWVIV